MVAGGNAVCNRDIMTGSIIKQDSSGFGTQIGID